MQRNPFPVEIAGKRVGWKWIDETGAESEKLYKSQGAALKDLLQYIDYLETGKVTGPTEVVGPTGPVPTWAEFWRFVWSKVVEFVRA